MMINSRYSRIDVIGIYIVLLVGMISAAKHICRLSSFSDKKKRYRF